MPTTKPVEREEEFEEAVFTDMTSPLKGGGQISEELIAYYAALGKKECTEQYVRSVTNTQVGELQKKLNKVRWFNGAYDTPEYSRLYNRIRTIRRKGETIAESLHSGKSTPHMIQSLASKLAERKPVSKFADFKAMVKKGEI